MYRMKRSGNSKIEGGENRLLIQQRSSEEKQVVDIYKLKFKAGSFGNPLALNWASRALHLCQA